MRVLAASCVAGAELAHYSARLVYTSPHSEVPPLCLALLVCLTPLHSQCLCSYTQHACKTGRMACCLSQVG